MFFEDVWQIIGRIPQTAVLSRDKGPEEDWEGLLLPEQEKVTGAWKTQSGAGQIRNICFKGGAT